MGTFQQFWRQPQKLWLRRALFQVHLWTGLGAGLYVLLISISGSAIVFRQDIFKAYESPVIHVEAIGERMTSQQIGDAAKRVYPGYEVTQVYEFENDPQRAVEVRLETGSWVKVRLVDPYTGADLGRAVPWQISITAWFYDLHVELFGGRTGRLINAAGGGLWVMLALTGVVVWWQGFQNWKRGLLVRLKSGWRRFNWDLHSSLGFWTLLLTLMWGVTGIFAAYPDPFRAAVEYFEPLPPAPVPRQRGTGVAQSQDGVGQPVQPVERGRRGGRPRRPQRVGDRILRGAYALHFGNFAGTSLKIGWLVLGLVPGVLFITGTLMWVNRKFRRPRNATSGV